MFKKTFKRTTFTIMFFLLLFSFANISFAEESSTSNFKLYSTANMYNFIELDTRSGKMWQVQFSNKDESRFTTILNSVNLSPDNDSTTGRFALHPTQNMYTFILLDQINGKTWQIQWSFDADKRVRLPII